MMTIGAIRSARWPLAAGVFAASLFGANLVLAQDAPPSSEPKPPAPPAAPPPPATAAPTPPADAPPPPSAEPKKEEPKADEKGEREEHHGEHGEHHGEHAEHGGHGEHHHGEHGDKKEHEEEEEHRVHVVFDMVVGFGSQLPVATQGNATSATPVPAYQSLNAKITTESMILGLGFEIVEGFSVGARMPLTIGEVNPQLGNPTRTTTTPGNLELEGEFETEIAEHLKFVGSLGFALPTAQGQELPEADALANTPPANLFQADYDRGAINRAASLSRGLEDSALFEAHRFGIIPKIGIDYQANGLTLAPYVKVENLIRTQDDLEHKYIGELVIGARGAYRVEEHLDLGLRLWTNINFAGTDDKVAVVEPEIRMHFGGVQPYVGWLFPFAGKVLTDPYVTGGRVGVAAEF